MPDSPLLNLGHTNNTKRVASALARVHTIFFIHFYSQINQFDIQTNNNEISCFTKRRREKEMTLHVQINYGPHFYFHFRFFFVTFFTRTLWMDRLIFYVFCINGLTQCITLGC